MPIRVEQDDRIRAIGSVLLLTDLVKMNNGWKAPAIKTLSIEHVTPFCDHPCIEVARKIDPVQSMGAAFHCFAVNANVLNRQPRTPTGPAAYGSQFDEHDFTDLIADFCHVSGLVDFWGRTSDLWDEAIADCRSLLAEEDPGEFLDLFYGDMIADLVVVPSPLSPTSFCYGPRAGDTAYAIIGPPNVPRDSSDPVRYSHWKRQFQELVFHEFSHSLLNAAEDLAPVASQGLYVSFGAMPSNAKFRRVYGDEPDRIWFDEIMIRAATALYAKASGREREAAVYLARQEEEYGLLWIRRIYNALEDYLEQRKSGEYLGLHEFLPALHTLFT